MVSDWALPTIDLELCNRCELCVTHCPTHAVEMSGGHPRLVRPQDCSYCGDCEEICTKGAIALEYEIVLPSESDSDT